MKKNILLILFIALQPALHAQFDNVGTSAMNFLKIGVGARGIAMGSSQVASVNDATALYWNPSGIANLTANQVLLSNNNWIADLSHNFLAAVVPAGEFGVIGVSVSYLSMGDMKVTDWDNTYGTGQTFSANSAAIGIGWARHMNDRFMVGVQLKLLHESIANTTANSFAVDVGSQYDIGWLRLGMSLQNFGPQTRLEGRDLLIRTDPLTEVGSNPSDVTANLETQNWSLPIVFQIGVAVTPYRGEYFRLSTSVDYRDERDYRAQTMMGAEFVVQEMVFLRGGVRNRVVSTVSNSTIDIEQEYLLSAGIGVVYGIPTTDLVVHFDYAFQELAFFNNSQLISVAFDF
ncbi:MAG: PorV/PorQ family protein [Bacteroidota bacterium]